MGTTGVLTPDICCRWKHAQAGCVHRILHRGRLGGDSSSLGRPQLAGLRCALHHFWRAPVSALPNVLPSYLYWLKHARRSAPLMQRCFVWSGRRRLPLPEHSALYCIPGVFTQVAHNRGTLRSGTHADLHRTSARCPPCYLQDGECRVRGDLPVDHRERLRSGA